MSTLAGIVPGVVDTHVHQWDPFTTPREASRLAPLYRRYPRLLGAVFPLLIDKGGLRGARGAPADLRRLRLLAPAR